VGGVKYSDINADLTVAGKDNVKESVDEIVSVLLKNNLDLSF
jgi:hypothetical protein